MTNGQQEILALAAELAPDGDRRSRLRRRMRDKTTDTRRLIARACREGLVCLLYRNLKRAGALGAFSEIQRHRIRDLYLSTAACNLNLIHHLTEILEKTRREDIPVVLLQGIPLLYQVYDDVGLRPMTDIDLWVLPAEFDRLVRVLADLDYHGDRLYPRTFRKGPVTLDIHTHILGGDRVRSRRWILARDQSDLYAATRPIDIEGGTALCLERRDQVLYLALHALKHNVNRLIWLADIKFLVSSWTPGDWRDFTARAVELGQVRSVACLFFLLRDLLHFEPPGEVRSFFGEDRIPFPVRRMLRRRAQTGAFPPWAPFFLFAPEKGGLKRIFFLMETLFPGKTVLRQVFSDFPEQSTGRLYLMRIIQILAAARISLRKR